jgi:hypothetical protein
LSQPFEIVNAEQFESKAERPRQLELAIKWLCRISQKKIQEMQPHVLNVVTLTP